MPQTYNLNDTFSGTIYDAHDAPLKEVTVQAFDKDLRSEQLLVSRKQMESGIMKFSKTPRSLRC